MQKFINAEKKSKLLLKKLRTNNMFLLKHIGRSLPTFKRFLSSALYLTGDKAQTTFVVVKPHLDFDERLEHEDLEANIKARKISVNLNKIKNRWHMFKVMDDQKTILEVTRTEIGKLITKLMTDEEKHRDGIMELKTKAKLVKNDYLNIRDYLYGLEESAALGVLSLPNILHPLTPIDSVETIVQTHLEKPEHQSLSHLEIAKEKDLVYFINPMHYYHKNEAALFELSLQRHFNKSLKSSDFRKFSNPGFSRSVIVEACDSNFNGISKVVTLEDPQEDKPHEYCRLHLTGGASLQAFMAYFTKHIIQKTLLPMRLFSEGRLYRTPENENHSFFNLYQETATTMFVALPDDESLTMELENIQAIVFNTYKKLPYHFRMVYLPADQLDLNESLRLSIQMFSSHFQEYVEVGNVSIYDTYLSKKLLFTYDENKQRKFPKVISGSLLRVSRFIACALENDADRCLCDAFCDIN